jgi:hypothetical protein
MGKKKGWKRGNVWTIVDGAAYCRIDSKKHGIYHAIVDIDRMSECQNHTWSICVTNRYSSIHAVTNINGKLVKMHQFLYGIGDGKPLYHVSKDGLDNRFANIDIYRDLDF